MRVSVSISSFGSKAKMSQFSPNIFSTFYSFSGSLLHTLLFGRKRFLHCKGPKNTICLWLRERNIEKCQINIVRSRLIFIVSAKDIFRTFIVKEFLKDFFGPKSNISSHEKLVFRSGVQFLFLFLSTEANSLTLNLQKKDIRQN